MYLWGLLPLGLSVSTVASYTITFYNDANFTGASYSSDWDTNTACTGIALGYWPTRSGSVEVSIIGFEQRLTCDQLY